MSVQFRSNKNRTGVCFLLFCLIPFAAAAQNPKARPASGHGGQDFSRDRTLININNISMWAYANGLSARTPDGNSGGIFPRGTTGVIFADGLIWGGKVRDGQEPALRAGGQTYTSGTVPGAIVSKGMAEDFNDPAVNRIWRIRRDYFTADLSRDAAESHLKETTEVTAAEVEAVLQRYAADWHDWPWQKGAPFYDAEGDGVYTPRFNAEGSPVLFPDADEPGLAGADQVVWFVVNDLDFGAVQTFRGSPPIGLEMQVTLWAYREPEVLRNIIFKDYRFVYEGTAMTPEEATVDSFYVGQWSDPDIGAFGDDLVGCDTFLNLGFAYNLNEEDAAFARFSLPPPATGYDLSAGVLVPEPGGTARLGLQEYRGFRNLSMSSFAPFLPSQNDPPRNGAYILTIQSYNMLRGYRQRPEFPVTPWLDPGGNPTRFVFSGDPVAGVGWLDANGGDRRMLLASGPIDMALGDTNGFSVALIAGIGSDRLASVAVMKYISEMAQTAYDHFFELPKAPRKPQLGATALEGTIILNWSLSPDSVRQVEEPLLNGYVFEGYNVYQLPSPEARVEEGIRLATFDHINGIKKITHERFDADVGNIVPFVAQRGNDSGIFRTIVVNRDTLAARPITSGEEYYFAVTAYNYNPDRVLGLAAMESEPAVVTVRAHGLAAGSRLSAGIGDTLQVVRQGGKSDGEVVALVVDPTQLTGDEYEISFAENGGDVTWSLSNISRDAVVLSHMTNQSGDTDYLVTDGFKVIVTGPPLQGVNWSFDGARWISLNSDNRDGELVFGSVYLGPNLFGSNLPVSEYADVHMEWFGKSGFTDLNSNGQYDIGEPYQMRPFGGHQRAFFYEGGGAGRYLGFFEVPFSVFDSEQDPPRQLNTLIHDPDGNLQWDLHHRYEAHDPSFVDVNGGDFRFNYVFIMNTDYDATGMLYDPGQGGIDAFADIFEGGQPVQWLGWWGRRGSSEPVGDSFTLDLIAPNANSKEDVFTFKSLAPTFDRDVAQRDVLELVNIFPNPYLGAFNREARGFVTFSHLPQNVTVRIFNLAGTQVRRLQKRDSSQFLPWDLKNEQGRSVANGVYVAHIEMPELGVSKILKLVVFPE